MRTKPDSVTKTEASNEILVAALAVGHPYAAAAETAGMSERTVRRRMADPSFAAEVAARRSLHVAALTGRLLATADAAVQVITDCLSAERPADQLKAAELMLTFVRRFHADSNVDARLTALEAAATQGGAE